MPDKDRVEMRTTGINVRRGKRRKDPVRDGLVAIDSDDGTAGDVGRRRADPALTRQFQCLHALQRHGHLKGAAHSCGMTPQELKEILREAECTYGRPLVRLVDRFDGFTAMGEVVLRCSSQFAVPPLSELGNEHARDDVGELSLTTLLARRSVSPKRLGPPGPSQTQLDLMLQVALRAPDHGSLHPWRVIEFREDAREALAELFAQEKSRRDPLASSEDLQLAREHATRAPVLLGFVVSPQPRSKVPLREQWLAAGAALCNLLNAAHQLGFGAIVLSGERCHDPVLLSQLKVQQAEFLAGFVSMGQVVQAPPGRKPVSPGIVWSRWPIPAGQDAADAPGDVQTVRLDSPHGNG